MRSIPLLRIQAGIVLLLLAFFALWITHHVTENESPTALADVATEPIDAGALVEAQLTTTRARAESVPSIASVEPEEQVARGAVSEELLVEVFDGHGHRVFDYGVKLEFRRLGVEPRSPLLLRYFKPVPEDNPERIVIPISELEQAFVRASKLSRGSSFEVALVLNSPLVNCSEHVFHNLVVPGEPVRLQIAAGGSVRVDVVDATGTPMTRPLRVRLQMAPSETAFDDDRAFERALGQSVDVAGGTHTFRDVVCPSVLEARVSDPSEVFNDSTLRALGPSQPGDEISMTLRLDKEAPRITGRLMEEMLQPLHSQSIELAVETQRGLRAGPIQTDDTGRFSFPWPTSARELGRADTFIFSVTKGTPRRLIVAAPEIPATGTVDLGDLVLKAAAPQERIAAGIVVDGEGRPLAGVSIELSEVWPTTPTGPWEVDRPWGRSTDPTGPKGIFEVHGSKSIRGLRLEPRLYGYVAASSTIIQPCQMDLVLVMQPAASLSGSVLLDEPELAKKLFISTELNGKRGAKARVGAEGRFTLGNLISGRFTVRVELGSLELASVDGIEVFSGTETRDARLDPLDLRGMLKAWRLRLRDAQGSPLPQLDVRGVPNGTSGAFLRARSDEEGLCVFATENPVDSLRLFVASYASTEVKWNQGEQVIVLSDWPALRVRVTGLALVPREYDVVLSLRAAPADHLDPLRSAAASFDNAAFVEEGKECAYRIAWPGMYEHFWSLRLKRAAQIVDIGAVPIEISSEVPSELIEIAPPAQSLENAIAEMRRRVGR